MTVTATETPEITSTAPTPPGFSDVIYPETGMFTIISRGWNLFRLNAKPSIVLLLLPAVVNSVVGILASVPAAFPALFAQGPAGLLVTVGSAIAGLVLAVAAWFLSMGCFALLIRLYYATLVLDRPISLAEAFHDLKPRLPELGMLILLLLGVYIGCAVVMLLLFVAGAATLMAASGIAAFVAFTPGGQNVLALFAMLLVGAAFLLPMLGLLGFMFVAMFFPLVAAGTAGNDEGLFPRAFASWRLLFAMPGRAGMFGLMLFFVYAVMAVVLHLPVELWMAIEFKAGRGLPGVIPIHVSTVANVWTSLANAVIVPFILGAMTLFWYDCRVRYEAFDLRLRLARLAGQNDIPLACPPVPFIPPSPQPAAGGA